MKKMKKRLGVLAHSTLVPNFKSFGFGTTEIPCSEDLTGERRNITNTIHVTIPMVWLKYNEKGGPKL